MNMVVNGRWVDAPEQLSYEAVAILVRGKVEGPLLTVVYRHASEDKSGILAPGESITVDDRTVVNAFVTGNA